VIDGSEPGGGPKQPGPVLISACGQVPGESRACTTSSARTACLHRRRYRPAVGKCLARTSPSSSRKAAWPGLTQQPGQPGCQVPEGAAVIPVLEQTPGTRRPATHSQVAEIKANTSRNSRSISPRACYSYCMISPIREISRSCGFKSPSDTLNPYELAFPGMLGRHPRPASGRGGRSVSWFSYTGLLSLIASVSAALADGDGRRVLAGYVQGPVVRA
jgi:hypothetical protein